MSPRWTPDPNIRRGRSVVFNLHVHLVFVTKYRRDVLNDPILTRCEQIMRDVCAGMGAELREFNGADDHVHLLVHYPPKLAISTLVNSLKGVSAHYLRKEFTGRINRHIIHRTPMVPVLLRRLLRRGSTRSGQGVHRKPEASRSVTRFLPALNGRDSPLMMLSPRHRSFAASGSTSVP